MHIDILMEFHLVSILVLIQIFYLQKKDQLMRFIHHLYRLVKLVDGRNRAIDGVVLRTDIIEPSYTGMLSGDSVIVLFLKKNS